MYDLAYDPREKFNLAAAFNHMHKDVARPSEGGVPFHHVSSRINSNTKKASLPETLPKSSGKVEFVNSMQLSGWHEIYSILTRLRSEARKHWKETGRGDHFHF